ncbi:hypothetical protein EDD36DRAFT_461249 [Exophiala viscosa]|uniref:Luciferase domain-containing protein n=1 Tax=Exophiala viscosa TaxID=2486360 RepID=A0AAN6E1V4_9EURO|nr:hypothetical protein EDD36DRAFT_461249 [Exophiala viscosa]
MANIMTFSVPYALLYALGAIVLGTAAITLVLHLIDFDIEHCMSTKQGVAIQNIFNPLYERLLQAVSVSEQLATTTPSSPTVSYRGYLETLPRRTGSRPIITGVSSPRQTTQLPPTEKQVTARLREVITNVSARYPSATYLGRSTFESEPTSPITLYARHRVFDKTQYYGEILKANKADGLIECTLHPSDVRTVIETGWAQRHPLSTRLASWLVWGRGGCTAAPTPASQVLLYAPRDQADLEVIGQVVNAAVWWVGGIDSRLDDESS